jgi:hypothetical protein
MCLFGNIRTQNHFGSNILIFFILAEGIELKHQNTQKKKKKKKDHLGKKLIS